MAKFGLCCGRAVADEAQIRGPEDKAQISPENSQLRRKELKVDGLHDGPVNISSYKCWQ